ncbi:Ku protein [Flaviflagellibacter deserti]|uniref:Non-homologous end joining protein Ku n=1 Tax=Flaviflagellibacter deserti TaxID=2267266 RepID=A0ABV9Z1L1_9HYPH
MAPTTRSWKGYLKLSLVTCAVAMAPAQTDRDKTRFHTLNKETGNRLRMQWIDAETGDVVENEDRARGYEYAKGEHIIVEEEDFEAIALESRTTIDVDQFVPKDEVDWLWTGDHHYLVPDDEVAVEAFSVIRDAMAATKTNGIARVTINKRERWVLVAPRDRGILITTLRYPYEVRSEAAGFERISGVKPDEKDVETMRQVIRTMMGKWDASKFEDRYETAVKKMLSDKQKGHVLKPAPAAPDAPQKHEKVVSMFDALRRSIEAEEKKRPKAESKKRGAAKAPVKKSA